MSKIQRNTSSKEKEKLRRRLQKLFQGVDKSEESVDAKLSKENRRRKGKQINNQETKGHEEQQVTDNSFKQTGASRKNIKNRQSQNKNPTTIQFIKQNEFSNMSPKQAAAKNSTKKQKILENINSKSKKSQLLTKIKDTSKNSNVNAGSKVALNQNTKSQKTRSGKNEVNVNSLPKKTENRSENEFLNKNKQKSINKSDRKQEKQNVPNCVKSSATLKQNSVNPNSQIKFGKNLKKKAQKRTATESKLSNGIPGSNKKTKNIKADFSSSSSSQLEDEFDEKAMTGCVRGGDFYLDPEEDAMEYRYWVQQNNYSSDGSENSFNSKHNLSYKQNGTELDHYETSIGDEEHFNSDVDYDSEFDDYYDDDSEEEENYSDFDENDYEEDEDSYDYSMNSEEDCSSNYEYDTNNSYDDSDVEYKLPEHVPEDLIIHKGTAIKRDLESEDNVTFDSDNDEIQIIELENQRTYKIINQPKAYEREELLKIKYKEKTFNDITFHTMEMITGTSNDNDDCPKLVPIHNDDGFQIYEPNKQSEVEQEGYGDNDEHESLENIENYNEIDAISLGSEYMKVDSDEVDSLLSENINEKYLRGQEEYDSDFNIDEDVGDQIFNVDIIDARKIECVSQDIVENDDINLNNDIKQIPSVRLFEKVDLKTACTILSTSIINKKIFKTTTDMEMEPVQKHKKVHVHKEEILQESDRKNLSELDCIKEQTSKVLKSNESEKSRKNIQQEEEVTPSKVAKSTGQSLLDYHTKFYNALDSNLVMVLLKDPFYIYGTVRLTLLAGSLDVYGHSLKLNQEVEIFSPRGCSVIEILPLSAKDKFSQQQLKEVLKSYEKHFALTDLSTICNLYNFEKDAIVVLKRNESRKKIVQQFKKFMNENVFPNINNINVDRPLYNSEYLLRCMINTSAQEQKCLRLPKQWEQICLTTKTRLMLTGGKSVGKSTLLRYLINRHLPQSILLIDLDIGQPEVFVPQTVSCTIVKQPLLGPGFMLNLQPQIAYAVGHTNIALCAHKYIKAVNNLIAYCKAQEEYQNLPWLINTMGYNKGFGMELISIFAEELPLTDVIQLQSNKEINNFDSNLYPHVLRNVPRNMFSLQNISDVENSSEKPDYCLHVWQSAVQQESRYQKEWEMSPKDLRFAILLTRLSEALQGHAEWLTDIKPLSASLNEIKIVNLLENTSDAFAEEISKSIEANVVYLCHHQQEHKPLKCLGIGVVRAIDFHVQQLYLIPAIPYTQLKEVNCLALGEMPLPSSIYTNQGSRVKNIAPYVYNTIAANASKAIKQIYHRPRKFLMGKHKSLD